ncbi:unnamed protein product [Moneuplotes crassus]|uniref:Thioredoxin-like fold domain-containing protein n=1 Tax=Euplotes crassus TaxID=5936 RepID=A0AAD1Y298_EUPCR|nr:unnamed protein product [Moneuplotes crassus]
MIDETLGTEFVSNNEEEPVVLLQKIEINKIALLFSAGWCPPSEKFIEKLTEFYNEVNKESKKFEIIYVSADRDQEQFNEHFAKMPWVAIPFDDTERIERLEDLCEPEMIPKLCFLTRNASEVTVDNAREIIEKAEDFAQAMEELGLN